MIEKLKIEGRSFDIEFFDESRPADERKWRFEIVDGVFYIRMINDAETTDTQLAIERIGTKITIRKPG